jgi:toxin ParE1/3/4
VQSSYLRRYIVKNFGMAVWLTSYGKLKDAAAMIQEHSQVDRIPPKLESLNIAPYRQVLSGMNRVIYEQRGDTADIHIVGDTRQDLQGLLMKRIVNS